MRDFDQERWDNTTRQSTALESKRLRLRQKRKGRKLQNAKLNFLSSGIITIQLISGQICGRRKTFEGRIVGSPASPTAQRIND
jgi:hypothetical protein